MAFPHSSPRRLLPLLALFFSTGTALPRTSKHVSQDDSPTYTALGCFVDEPSRVLPSNLISTGDMTAAKCAAHCAGYDYFGTQWSSECYCGNRKPANPAPESECNMPCSGNADEMCGAGMRLNAYKLDTTPVPPTIPDGFEYKGCFTDNVPQRVLAGTTIASDSMTVATCASTCKAGGYTWFGVEYGAECFCGTSLDAASTQVSEGDCDMKCRGDESQHCGGPSRLNVYQAITAPGTGTGASNLESVGEFRYASCWTDDVNDRSLTAVDWRTDDMTIEKCADRCKDFTYFGLEFSNECYCGNEIGGQAAPEKECGNLCRGDASQWCGGPNRLNLYTRAVVEPEPEPESSSSALLISSTLTSSAVIESSTPAPASSTIFSQPVSTTSVSTTSVPSTTTTRGPDLTTITSCPPTPTYNGIPELCYAALPTACQRLASSFLSRSLSTNVASCKAVMTRYGFTASPAAMACFPTTPIPAIPAATLASSVASSVFSCLNAPAASILCQSDSNCATATYTVGQVPSPTPSTGVDVLQGAGSFESGDLGPFVVSPISPHLTVAVNGARPHSGSSGLSMRYHNTNGISVGISTTVRVVPGATYQFSLWLDHTNPSATCSVYQYVYPVIAQTSFNDAQIYQTPANMWRQRTLTFTATSSWVQIQIGAGGNVSGGNGSPQGTNDIYVDDVKLIRIS